MEIPWQKKKVFILRRKAKGNITYHISFEGDDDYLFKFLSAVQTAVVR
jgi:hypothetical protein